jgi:hypothetical protein
LVLVERLKVDVSADDHVSRTSKGGFHDSIVVSITRRFDSSAGADEVGERRRRLDVGRQLVVTGRFSA